MGGGSLLAYLAAWSTFLCVLAGLRATEGDQGLLQDLGLDAPPDVSKINISLDEYTTVMRDYLLGRENSADDANTIPNLVTYDVDQQVVRRGASPSVRLRFAVPFEPHLHVEEAQLRFLAAPHPAAVEVLVSALLGGRGRGGRLPLGRHTLHLSPNATKWCDVDVTDAARRWMHGEANLGLEVACVRPPGCRLEPPLEAALTALVVPRARRSRRASPYDGDRRTDCAKGRRKRRCCRQNMKVDFTKLGFPEMAFIVAPKVYNVGYCHGLCPPNYNFATNHSRIQSLMHQMEKRNGSRTSRKAVPRTCCAPSKLRHLDIILVDKSNHAKLRKEVWDNMEIIECACS